MNGYKFYEIYSTLKLHFTTPYDLFKYARKTKTINKASYEKRKEKLRFEYWSNHFASEKKAGQFCMANFLYNDIGWFYQAYAQAEEVFLKWKALTENLKSSTQNAVILLKKTLEEKQVNYEYLIHKTPKGNRPPLLQLFLAGQLSKEHLAILDALGHPFLDAWQEQYEIDPFISDQIFLIKKYQPFIINMSNKDTFFEILKELEIK
jgi:hypothetical protein